MKFQVTLKILFRLLKTRKASAAQMAREFGVSERSIYRYVEELIVAGVPIDIIRGRNGGICLPDTFKLPVNFFSKDEYTSAVNALSAFSEQIHDDSVRSALEKLRQQQRANERDLAFSGHILVDSGTWGDTYDFSETMRVLEDAIERRICLDVTYIDRGGEESRRILEPLLLVYKQNIWYLYAWCRKREDFRLFRIGRIRSARITEESFRPRPFDRKNLPLQFQFPNTPLLSIRLAVQPKALPDVEEWLGIRNIHGSGENIVATATLPGGEILLSKLLAFGDGIRVLEPEDLAKTLCARATQLIDLYR